MSDDSRLKAVYNLLKKDAPEAAIGSAAASFGILLLTVGAATNEGSGARLILYLASGSFFALGLFGFALAMFRARSKPSP